MSKQIAVFMCAINIDNQKIMLDGMVEAAKKTDANLYVFTNYVSYRDKMENILGAYQLMELPDFRNFDGVILARNSLYYPPAVESLLKRIEESKIPAVSIDVETPNMSFLGVSSYEAQLAMLEHFFVDHGCKDLVYVAGPDGNVEAKKRYDAYVDALKKHGINFDPANVYKGSYTSESGEEVAKEILKREKLPEAIVCANDAMAIAIIDVLKSQGVRVPEDVKVAGYDNTVLGKIQNPPLTSVSKNQHEVGCEAVYELLSLMKGNAVTSRYISCKLEIRSSCGCIQSDVESVDKLKDGYVHEQVTTLRVADVMRNMTAEFSGMEDPAELAEVLKAYVPYLEIEKFYLCLCEKDTVFKLRKKDLSDSIDLSEINTDYTPMMHIPMAYEKGKFTTYEDFPKGFVLPEECRQESGGNYYIIAPLYYQRCCYGYCVCGNSRFPLDQNLFFAWVMDISIGLENIRKWKLLKDTVVKLNYMWVYDMLTHLYNRAGFYHYAESRYKEWKEQGATSYIMFMDLDGLKQVNDNIGHDAGDALIREMAESVKCFISDDRIAMRYGGDEFVVFGKLQEGETEEKLVAEMQSYMDRRNAISKFPFMLRASIGVSVYKAQRKEELSAMIELADQKMYEEKRKKKEQEA